MTGAPPVSAMEKVSWLRADANPRALKSRMAEFFSRFVAVVEGASDAIVRDADEPAMRRAALEWKAQCVALAQSAMLRPDPLASLFDGWTLCKQLHGDLVDGPGRERFGAAQPAAIAAIERLEACAIEIAQTVVAAQDLSPLRGMVDEATARYPIDGPLYARRSPVIDYADRVGEASGLTQIAANMDLHVADMARKMTVYGALAPRQARWQAELMLHEPLAAIVDATTRLAVAVEGLPDRLREERVALTAWLREERDAVLGALTEQREAALATVAEITANERRSVLDAIVAERRAVLAAIAIERGAMVDAIDAQRVATIDAIDAQRTATIQALRGERAIVVDAARAERRSTTDAVRDVVESSFPRARELIDHFILRVGLLGAIGFVAVALLAFALRRRAS